LPFFSRTFTQGVPLINMSVGVSLARSQALVAAGQQAPQMQIVQGLIDTGASGTCIDPLVLNALQIQATGVTPMLTPSTGGTPIDADTFDVAIMIQSTPNAAPLFIPNMAVAASELFAAQGFHVLVGRDILSRCIMTYNGASGLFMLAF
jgi:hypothetical protein